MSNSGYPDTIISISTPNFVRFLFVMLDEERSLQIKVDTADELLASILDAAGCVKRREDQLRRTARDIRTRAAVGFWEHLL